VGDVVKRCSVSAIPSCTGGCPNGTTYRRNGFGHARDHLPYPRVLGLERPRCSRSARCPHRVLLELHASSNAAASAPFQAAQAGAQTAQRTGGMGSGKRERAPYPRVLGLERPRCSRSARCPHRVLLELHARALDLDMISSGSGGAGRDLHAGPVGDVVKRCSVSAIPSCTEAHVARIEFYSSCMRVHSTWTATARRLLHEELWVSHRKGRASRATRTRRGVRRSLPTARPWVHSTCR
jgi:hypothetical protein